MENRRFEGKNEPEIVYSRSVKAGKRIYYLDVKKARNEDLYLCITESKRKQTGETETPQFEKHKVFLYKEDFAHFTEGLNDVIAFVQSQLGEIEERKEWTPETEEEGVQELCAQALNQRSTFKIHADFILGFLRDFRCCFNMIHSKRSSFLNLFSDRTRMH